MRLEQQKSKLQCSLTSDEIRNIIHKNGPLLPPSIRGVICGPSGSGKTSIMVELIKHRNGLRFKNLFIFGKTVSQPKYLQLVSVIKMIPEMMSYTDSDIAVSVENVPPFSVIVFDDLLTQKQGEIQKYFSMGRHKQLDVFFICQTYSFIKKQLIRDNLNLIILFRMDLRNLRHVFNDHIVGDMTFDEFVDMCNKCWNKKDGFMVIDKDSPMNKGRYRCGFDKFFIR